MKVEDKYYRRKLSAFLNLADYRIIVSCRNFLKTVQPQIKTLALCCRHVDTLLVTFTGQLFAFINNVFFKTQYFFVTGREASCNKIK
ncbi:MAG: hypothetical protein ACI9MS_001755 [Glaciecola sp.]|jgi:hypothetical protein